MESVVKAMEDNRIIELFYARSEQAIAELSNKYGAVCRRIARNILNSEHDSEECVNDGWLAVWNTVPPQRPDPLLTYVCRIVRNLATARLRYNTAQKRHSPYDVALDELGDCFPSADDPAKALEAAEVSRAIDRFLAGLPQRDRVMFVRRYWYGDPPAAVARHFGVTAHYVSVRLSRLRERLKQHLIEEGVFL